MNGHDASNGGSAGEAALGLLASRTEAIVRASDKQLKNPKDHSAKTKSVSQNRLGFFLVYSGHELNDCASLSSLQQAVLGMLKSLAHVLPGGLENQLTIIMEDIKRCLKDKSQVSP